MNGTVEQYRKRPTNDMGLEVSSTGVETRISEDIRFSFSVSDTEAESNFSDCFDLSHEKRLGDLSCSLEATADMRGTVVGTDKRRKRDSQGKYMHRQTWRISILPNGKTYPLTQICLRQTYVTGALAPPAITTGTHTLTSHHG
jgi:hypothetical protein